MRTFKLGTLALVFCAPLVGATARTETLCPHDPLESCRWELRVRSESRAGRPVVIVDWDKSVISRHTEKPLARALACNVDRAFDFAGGGFLRVWFRGETQPCDATATQNPEACGVKFVFDPASSSPFPIGYEVSAPAGKELEKVENRNTLSLQCGDFTRAGYGNWKWDATLGWNMRLPGDGTYFRQTPPVKQ